MKKYFGNLYPIIVYVVKIQFLILFLLFTIRAILLITNLQNMEGVASSDIFNAFSLGFFIDNVAVSFISVPPLIGAAILSFSKKSKYNFVLYIYNIYYIIIYFFILGFSIADISYFNYFFKHIDISILDWFKNDTDGIKMLYTESSYYKYYLLFIIIALLFSLCLIYFSKQWKNYEIRAKSKNSKKQSFKCITICIILGVICYMGIFRKHHMMQPILQWTAYLNPNSFVNELTVSPIYNFIISINTPKHKDKKINTIDQNTAFNIIKQDFIYQDFIEDISPICREVKTDQPEIKANLIIVLMESMSSYYMNETPQLTPYLNDLKKRSYYFNNFYSTGTHTNIGVFSTLYGIPAFFDRVITDDRAITGSDRMPLCEGLPFNLNKKNYTSSFFISHKKSFNNMDMFLLNNGYLLKNIYSEENYPPSKYVNNWGVDDNYLFQYAVNKLTEKQESPFFATILTITNHPKYVVPADFKHISNEPSEQAVYYADYSIQKFMESAAKEKWFDNTIFVFLGDHGKLEGKQEFEMPLSLNHIPLIIYSPLFKDIPKTIENFGTQIDVFPTIMGLLNIEYENNSLGIDLFKEKRPYAVFTTDEKLGCINDHYLYCYNTLSKQEVMYNYKKNGITNLATTEKNAFDSIKNYAAATVQVTNYLLKNGLTRRKDHKSEKKED